MSERPELTKLSDGKTFRSYYYLKEELVAFCRENGLPVSGGKLELTERIACFLDTGKAPASAARRRPPAYAGPITEETIIERDIVCSEKHRAYFAAKIGKRFSFNVPFQKWLKANAGKTYGDAVRAYEQILKEKKKRRSTDSLSIISIFAISLRITLAKACSRRFSAGNTKRPCRDTTATKKATLRHWDIQSRKPQLPPLTVKDYFCCPYFSSISFVWAPNSSSAHA